MDIRQAGRKTAPLLLLIVLMSLSNSLFSRTKESLSAEKPASEVVLSRDEYGVPHILGKTDAGAAFGFGYAQAEDNFDLIETCFIKALGRGAEIEGENGLLEDRIVRAFEIPFLARQEYEKSSLRMKSIFDAYAAGLNFYLEKHPEIKPALLNKFEPWFPLAFLRYKYYVTEFIWQSGISRANLKIDTGLKLGESPEGSNAWAVGPSKSAAGRAMLFINPHVSINGLIQYFEGHIQSEEGWNFSGVSWYGCPFPYIGHNEYLGWSYTDNDCDFGDTYCEIFDKADNPLAYKYGQGYKNAVEWDEIVKIKKDDGWETRKLVFRKTHHGPLVSEYQGKPVAVKIARLEEGGWFEQWYEMTKSRSLSEFKKALSNIRVANMNIVYADREGNIFYCYYGAIAKRNESYKYRAPLDGSNPETEWNGYHAFEELPQVLNPSSGYILNCNSSPFAASAADNPSAKGFPAYMVGPGDRDNARAKVSHEILSGTGKFTFEDWKKAATDRRVYAARDYVERIKKEYAQLRPVDQDRAEAIREVVEELEGWNCVSDVNSAAMTLFGLSLARIQDQANVRYNYDLRLPALRKLELIKDYLVGQWGTWKVPWGEINRIQRVHWNGREPFDDKKPSFPAAGASGGSGIIFCLYWESPGYDLNRKSNNIRKYGVMGNSYVAVVEFGPKINAASVLGFGQSGDPKSAHHLDQAELFAAGKFKNAWFSTEDVLNHKKRTYRPGDR